jgi:hypothetical protein
VVFKPVPGVQGSPPPPAFFGIDRTLLSGSQKNAKMVESFIIQTTPKEIRQEKEKARALRKTRWWQQRLARGICHYCGREFPPSDLTLDHIVPLIRGGKTRRGNVVPSCKECNNRKKYLLPWEWEEYLQNIARKSSES